MWQIRKISRVMAIAALLVGFVSAAGCRSVCSSVEIKTKAVESFSSYKRAKVVVASKDADFSEQQIQELTGLIIEGLKNTGRFEDVYARVLSGELPNELTVSVVIPLVITTSLDGSQDMEALVTLVDSENGKMMANARIEVHAKSIGLPIKPSEVLYQLADQIIDYTRKSTSQ